jgi:hypothetical protein
MSARHRGGERTTVGTTSAAPAWLPRLAVELEDRHLETFVADIEEAVTSAVPGYARLPAGAGLRDGLRQTAQTYCRTLVEHRRLDADERLALHIIGSQRARNGLDADEIDTAVRLAVQVGWAFALRVLRRLGADAETVESVSAEAFPLTVGFLDDVRAGLLAGYRMGETEHLSAQVRVQAAVIDRLLFGGDEEALYETARAQSLDVRPPCGLLLVAGTSGGEFGCLRTAATELARLAKAIEGPGRPSATTPHVVVLASAATAEWGNVLSMADECARVHGVVVLAGQSPVDRLGELASAYRMLEADLHLAARARRGPGVVPRRQVAAYRMLSHIPPDQRVEFVADVLAPVLEKGERGRTYLRAYEAWVEADCNYEAAGALLNEAEHTVRYRVDNIEKLTGLDVRSGEGRFHLDLAVRLDRGWVEEVVTDRYQRP